MTLTQQCKALGLNRSSILIERTGDSRQNLQLMLKSNPRRLDLLIKGVLSEIKTENKK